MNNFLNKYSVKAKIIGIAAFFLVLMLISSAYALLAMNKIKNELTQVAEQDIPMTKLLTTITEHQLEQAILFERAARFGDLLDREEKAAHHFKLNIDEFEQLSHQVTTEIRKGEALAESIVADLDHQEEIAKEFSHITNELKEIEKQHENYEHHAQQVFSMLSQGKMHETESIIEKVELEEDKLGKRLESLRTEIESFTEKAILKAKQHEHKSMWVLGTLLLTAIVLGMLLRTEDLITSEIKHS